MQLMPFRAETYTRAQRRSKAQVMGTQVARLPVSNIDRREKSLSRTRW
jgi:hypothetical protein